MSFIHQTGYPIRNKHEKSIHARAQEDTIVNQVLHHSKGTPKKGIIFKRNN